jgi:hypothetical protein
MAGGSQGPPAFFVLAAAGHLIGKWAGLTVFALQLSASVFKSPARTASRWQKASSEDSNCPNWAARDFTSETNIHRDENETIDCRR